MLILSFICTSKIDNIISAELISSAIYTNTMIQVSEYQNSIQLTDWINIDLLSSLTQNISYAITNPNTTTLKIRLLKLNCANNGEDQGSETTSGKGSGSVSGSLESGISGSESGSGCEDCISDTVWVNLCGSESGSIGPGSHESGSGSGSGSESGPIIILPVTIPLPPSRPDQHFQWPPNQLKQEDWFGTGDVLDENNFSLGADLWTLAYIEKVNLDITECNFGSQGSESGSDESGSGSGSDESGSGSDESGSGPRYAKSSIWFKRRTPYYWPTANGFTTEVKVIGKPIGINLDIHSSSGQKDIDWAIEWAKQGNPIFYTSEMCKIEKIGGYFIELIKWIGENQPKGDGSSRIVGGGVSVIPNIYTADGQLSTEGLRILTEELI